MSKGNTQANAMKSAQSDGTFDDVAYAGFRHRLLAVMQTVGFMRGERSLDHHLKASETEWGFASVLRCSLTAKAWNKKKRAFEYSAASAGVIRGFKNEFQGWLTSCLEEHLLALSRRTRLVVLLGNSESYPGTLKPTLQMLFPDFREGPGFDGLVYRAGGRLFVHVGHPSRGNGYFNEFIYGSTSTGQGHKRELAKRAITMFLASEMKK